MEEQNVPQNNQTQTPASISLVEQNKPRLKSKIKISLFVISIVILLISGAYYLGTLKSKSQVQNPVVTSTSQPTSTPDETANWKIYVDSVNRFSIKYPNEWREEKIEGLKDVVYLTPNPIENAGNQEQRIAIGVVTNTNRLSSREYLDQVAIPPQKGSACEGKIKVIPDIPESLKNLDVTIADGFCGILEEGFSMYISKGDMIVGFSSGFYEVTKDNRNIVNKIYSSVKFYDENQGIPSSSESRCIAEYRAITDLIVNFESLQREKDALKILTLFTPPVTNEEIDSYNFLVGKKTGVVGLYGNVTTNFNEPSYEMIGVPVQNKNVCTISIEEQRSSYSNANPVGYQPAGTYKANFDVIKQGNSWKIDRYYPNGPLTGQPTYKYSAWGY